MHNYHKGPYKVKNKSKYVGNPNKVISRSSWEHHFYTYLDNHPNVIKWNSEGTVIPYIHPVKGTHHRYFVDATIQLKNSNGEIKTYIAEVKPLAQTMPPKKPQRLTESYKNAVETFLVNQAKWEAAKEFAARNGIEFIIITEKNLFGKTTK